MRRWPHPCLQQAGARGKGFILLVERWQRVGCPCSTAGRMDACLARRGRCLPCIADPISCQDYDWGARVRLLHERRHHACVTGTSTTERV